MLLKAFCCCFAVTKELANYVFPNKRTRKDKDNPVVKSLTTTCTSIASAIMLIILAASTVPFVLLKTLVYIYLKITCKNFGGFLNGMSPTCELEEEKLAIITVFMLRNNPGLYNTLREITGKIHESNAMFSSFVDSCLGYKYYLNNQVKHEDVISKKCLSNNNSITKRELVDYFEKYKIIGSIDRRLWEVVFFEQAVLDDDGQEKTTFMIRINHCITDAYFMIALFEKYLRDDYPKKITPQQKIKATGPGLDDIYLYNNPLAQPMEEFLFHGSDHQYISVFIENKFNYVPRIKAIKNRVGVGFSDVLLAGVVYGVSKFLKKKLGTCSNKMNIMATTRGRTEDIEEILNGTFDTNELANEFALIGFPASTTDQNESAIEIVRNMHKTYRTAKLSVDAMLGYVCTKLQWQFFPTILLKKLYDILLKYLCLVFTNMSAVEKASIQGQDILNIFSFVPLHVEKGIMMSVVTYDKRLHLTLVAREHFLDSRDELDDIMRGIFDFINKLEDEVKSVRLDEANTSGREKC